MCSGDLTFKIILDASSSEFQFCNVWFGWFWAVSNYASIRIDSKDSKMNQSLSVA